MGFHPRIRKPSISLQFRQPRNNNGDPPGRDRPARCGNPSPTRRSLIDWGSYIEPAHPREDRFPSPIWRSFHTSTTQVTRGRKHRSTGLIPPRRVWKPQPNWLVVDWLRLMEPEHPREDRFPSPHCKSFHTFITQTTRGRKRRSTGLTPPRRVWKPQPNWLVVDWLRLMKPARGGSYTSGQRQRPAAPGEDKILSPGGIIFYFWMRNLSIPLQHQQPWDVNRDRPGRYRPARCGNPKPTG